MGAAKYDVNDFNARIKRIRNPRNISYYDRELGMHIPKHVSRDKIRKVQKAAGFNFSAFLTSMVLGAFALGMGQLLRVQYFGLLGGDPASIALDFVCAFWVLMLVTVMMGHRGFLARMAQIAGLYVMLIAGHNLVWRWPDQMGRIYSPAYVQDVKTSTVPRSVIINGSVYAI
jgi:hypothetical protein